MTLTFAPEFITHPQKVCNLYKRALRLIESYYVVRHVVRYHQVLLRNRFECNRCVEDPIEKRRLLRVAENEWFSLKNPLPPAKFPTSLGIAQGVAYGRVVPAPDWVLDYWHPLEKAQYPDYFKRREQRKNEYVEHWKNGTLY